MSSVGLKRGRDEDLDVINDDGDDVDDQDDGDDGDGDEGGTGDESNLPDLGYDKSGTGAEDGNGEMSQSESRKRERTNAKAVECLDLDGNVLEVFRSGSAASAKLNIPQGDISLCCRGQKVSINGYKFRFSGEAEERQTLRLKKGFVIDYGFENTGKTEQTRTTRASRGEYGQGARFHELSSRSILDPPELKSRTWKLETVRVGPLLIKKWLPSTSEPTAALQDRIPRSATEARLKLSKRRRTLNRLSIGSNLPHKPAHEEAV